MHRHAYFALVTVLVSISVPCVHAQTTLRWDWKADESLQYRIVEEVRLGSEQRGLTEKLVLDTTWTITKSGADQWEIAVNFDRIQFTASGDVGSGPLEVAYDSAIKTARGPASEALQELLDAILRSKIQVKLDSFGHLTETELPQELLEQLRGTAAQELAGFFGDSVSMIGLKRGLRMVAVPLPEDVVSAGDTWKDEYKMDIAVGNLTAISGIATYTYLGPSAAREGSIAKIREQAEEDLELAGIERDEAPQRKVSGSIDFDVARGALLKRTSTRKHGTFSEVTTTVERKAPRE